MFESTDLIFLQPGHGIDTRCRNGRAGNDGVDEFLHARPLHRHGGVIVRRISQLEVAGKFRRLGLQPRDVVRYARCVDNEKVNSGGKLKDIKVVHHAATPVAHQGILAFTGNEFADVVGKREIKKLRRPRR